jgi:hypothetical protein
MKPEEKLFVFALVTAFLLGMAVAFVAFAFGHG